VDVSATSLHSHVGHCYLKANLPKIREIPQGERDLNDTRSDTDALRNIQNVQKYICKMDLRTRLGIAESFYRLSKSQDAGELPMSPRNPAVNLKTQAHDSCVLNMLYGTSDMQALEEPLSSIFNSSVPKEPFREVVSEFDLLPDHTGEEHEMLIPSFDGHAQVFTGQHNNSATSGMPLTSGISQVAGNPPSSGSGNPYNNHGHAHHHFSGGPNLNF